MSKREQNPSNVYNEMAFRSIETTQLKIDAASTI